MHDSELSAKLSTGRKFKKTDFERGIIIPWTEDFL